MPANPPPANRLSGATSPYLLQHADNPVAWQEWGPAALALAREQDKPILLSIGYSACHWCHVMAHESFEDSATAAVMNRLFINIKVDREERPDLDKIYQTAHQFLARRAGGWPLTMFLTPDTHTPFFGGTYFPPVPRHGLPAFTDLLQQIESFYRENGEDVEKQNSSLLHAMASIVPQSRAAGTTLDSGPLDAVRRELEQHFDARHGGFGQAPKFPHPTNLERLLRHWANTAAAGTADARALDIARFSLQKMARGGIYDHLGGGFCRYSVDDTWMIPHFEKMLYDNGPLLALYSDAWQAIGDPLFRDAAAGIAAWVMREMQSPDGGYYATLDADSEGEEGTFYVWTRAQVQALLSATEYPLFARAYGLDRPANFEGKWHPHRFVDSATLASETDLPPETVDARLASARAKLFAAREDRIHPGRDEKILGAWNGLMIKGMARASRLLDEPAWAASAGRALDFVRTTLWRDGRLLATCKDGHAHLAAYLDDYAFLLDAILELLQVRWHTPDLEFASELAEVLLKHFEDPQHGGFFFTADDHEPLIQRPKPLADEAIPAGNGIAAFALQRLGHLLGNTRYLEAAEHTLKLAWPAIKEMPYAHNGLLLALEETLYPPEIIIVRGSPEAAGEWHHRCSRQPAPRRLSFLIPPGSELPAALANKTAGDSVVAWCCRGMTCSPPVQSLAELDQLLAAGEAG